MTPTQQRTPGILPICPPARKPLPHQTEQSVPVQARRSSRVRGNARPRADSRALQQRRLGHIPEEKIEPPLRPIDSISNSPETSTARKVLAVASQALDPSVEDFLDSNAGPRGEFPPIGTGAPAPRGRERAETMGAAARDYYRLQGEDPDKYDFQRGQQNFDFISRTFGDPLHRDLPGTISKWLWRIEETMSVEQQVLAVRGMKKFWLIR